ncbi:hypothetical protein, partial [Latilactobacillus curvatus]|uniref:hypothetical protein n=1 Tax=Latilactobacillus curvatus TaxID=28038 RepID=UPI00223A8F3D
SLNSFEYLIAIIKSSFMMYYIEQFVRNSIIGALISVGLLTVIAGLAGRYLPAMDENPLV